ncbi:uncharacterized protein EI97DRAFT_430164 [Westerdykella ornata]|uniref:Uncharacterized protein n=1 Tax=Westerdykella ornata TaxID=318751 RepID=A0A6A6JUZ8_WESOR|nr:uncharacterized protein EI97DRAFT_430164 [Westerdykella ornata]KAF2280441.1 hypothetical protein EI97DRAFT_430164 [Westerdykella ornata]
MSTLVTSIIPAATTAQTVSATAQAFRNANGSPIVNLTVGNYITIVAVILFGVGLGLFIWWYCGKKRVDARNKAKGVA